jgi:hypothetical protein
MTSSSLKSDLTSEMNLHKLSHILAFQSKKFEIIWPLFIDFFVNGSVGNVWSL